MTAPLFILAPGRSFTSVSCGMIGCHPQMYGLPEINLFCAGTVGELLKIYRRHTMANRYLDQGLLRSLAELAFAEQTEETVEAARAWLADNEHLTTDALFRDMQEWAGGRGLVDKSPFNVHAPASLQRIRKTIPEARFLHLTRHPGDTVKSGYQGQKDIREKTLKRFPGLAPLLGDKFDELFLPRSAFRSGPLDEVPDKAWLTPHTTIVKFLENVPAKQKMRMRGEDLLSDRDAKLTEIAEWLEISSSPEAIDAMQHPEKSPFATHGPKNARFGNDPNFLEEPALRPYTYRPKPLEWETPEGNVVALAGPVRALASEFGY